MIVLGNTPQPDAAFKILTPWWDILTRYLTAGIMTVALTTAALQATKDALVCSPAVECSIQQSFINSTVLHRDVCKSVIYRLNNETSTTVITTMADYRQYSFLDALCFQKGVSQWYPVYFPFILVAEALLLLLIDNFWIMYPKTSSALNHFVTLSMECYSSVGTHLDLFQVLSKAKKTLLQKQTAEESSPKQVKVEIQDGAESILLSDTDEDKSDGPPSETDDEVVDYHLDVSDAMTVKTLYERVEEFTKRYGHNHKLLTIVYRVRAALQILLCAFILVFHFYNLSLLSDVMKCELADQVFTVHYEYFVCARFIAPYYRAVTLIFAAAAFIYLLTISFAFFWSVKNTRRHDVYADVVLAGDKVHIGGDLAFLFSLLEQYNKLYCDRFAVFLSQGLKEKLDEKVVKALKKASLKKKDSVKEKAHQNDDVLT